MTNYFLRRAKFYAANQENIFFDSPPTSLNRVAFLSSMTNVIHANMRNKDKFTHIVCKEHVRTINVVMYFPKNFYLIETFNQKISN